MIKKYIVLIGIILNSIPAFSQLIYSVGPEMGVSVSGYKIENNFTIPNNTDKVKETWTPKLFVIGGLWGRVEYKNFWASLGVQYTRVGTNYKYHRNVKDFVYDTLLIQDHWNKQTFDQVTIPLNIGYSHPFFDGKIKPSVFVGVRPTYFTKGTFDYQTDIVESNLYLTTLKGEYDLFNASSMDSKPKPFNMQFTGGLGVELFEKIYIGATYAMGSDLTYENKNYGFWTKRFNNSAFVYTVKYAFVLNPQKRKMFK